MSYVFVVGIGAVAGWIAGQYLQESERGIGIDVAAGAIGAYIAVVLARAVGVSAGWFLISAIVAVIGASIAVFIARRVMKAKMLPISRFRRRS